LTPAAARRIVGFRADPTTESRIRALAEKCNEGDLTAEERREYERYVRDINFISTLQSQARRVLTRFTRRRPETDAAGRSAIPSGVFPPTLSASAGTSR
jgi:hypothetical protein